MLVTMRADRSMLRAAAANAAGGAAGGASPHRGGGRSGRTDPAAVVSPGRIAESIWSMRGLRVMLDTDLAQLYDVPTKALNQAVKRNSTRFPADFMFRLTWDEAKAIKLQGLQKPRPPRSQSVTLVSTSRGANVKYRPYAFTEQGVAMLSSVLRSERAIAVNVEIMRAFVKQREWLAANKELASKLDELERKIASHDETIASILEAIRELTLPLPVENKRPIGFA